MNSFYAPIFIMFAFFVCVLMNFDKIRHFAFGWYHQIEFRVFFFLFSFHFQIVFAICGFLEEKIYYFVNSFIRIEQRKKNQNQKIIWKRNFNHQSSFKPSLFCWTFKFLVYNLDYRLLCDFFQDSILVSLVHFWWRFSLYKLVINFRCGLF